ncbi:tyrosine-type recombinase/integrase [Nonomuraea sp. B1E8]|uniref:tyrosine-type recombinase/integrase n=1 Tax=unclassified Nonomuraea TaxID=2593643 RepID=UPI00325C665F
MFATRTGSKLSAANVRREVRRVVERAGLVPHEWTPRELRHSFVSLLSAVGVPIEHIARLIGHAGGSAVTEKVYRQQIRPVMQEGGRDHGSHLPRSGPRPRGAVSHSLCHSEDPKGRFLTWNRPLSWWAILGSNQ